MGANKFVTRNNLVGEDQMIVFSLRGQMPRISVVYFSCGQEYPHDSTIISQRCNLSDDEHGHLLDIIPAANTYVGVPFVTRLTNANLAKHNMVCSFKLLVLFPCLCVLVEVV